MLFLVPYLDFCIVGEFQDPAAEHLKLVTVAALSVASYC